MLTPSKRTSADVPFRRPASNVVCVLKANVISSFVSPLVQVVYQLALVVQFGVCVSSEYSS